MSYTLNFIFFFGWDDGTVVDTFSHLRKSFANYPELLVQDFDREATKLSAGVDTEHVEAALHTPAYAAQIFYGKILHYPAYILWTDDS